MKHNPKCRCECCAPPRRDISWQAFIWTLIALALAVGFLGEWALTQ